jgi:alanine racemase
MVDVTPIENVDIGDEVVLFGNQGNVILPVDELANILGTIIYEIVCRIGCRVPRVYVNNGDIFKISELANA